MLADPAYSELVTQTKCTIVTARPLMLYQESEAPPNGFKVPKERDLEILGDQVTILGRISAPGKTIKVFARSLLFETASIKGEGEQPAELNVDGAGGVARDAQMKAPGEGERGTAGFNTIVKPWKIIGQEKRDGGRGQSANLLRADAWLWTDPKLPAWARYNGEPENNWMHGGAGDPGNPGDNGGKIYLYCGSVSPIGGANLLILSAKGGKGGDGQAGQGGAKGGPGGNGSDAEHMGPGGYREATSGGPGGRGGDGGAGGRGGNGGNGGTIVFRTTNASSVPFTDYPGDGIKCFADGGSKGVPGQGGKGGEGGDPGHGGRAWGRDKWDSMRVEGGFAGERGPAGLDGADGPEGTDGFEGSVERLLQAKFGDLKSGFRMMK